ncbi:hypothetical protein E1A91_1Z016500v1, partial [Gossypium mustelinum]
GKKFIHLSYFSRKKKENKRSIEFQIVCFTNKIRSLTSHLELHKKRLFISERSAQNSRKMSTTDILFIEDK